MRLNQKLILLVSVFAGFFAFYLTLNTLNNAKKNPVQSSIVTAIRDLDLGNQLSSDDVKVLTAPKDVDPNIIYLTVEEVLGKTVRNPIRRGQPVTSFDLVSSSDSMAGLIPEGYRAKDVPTNLPKETLNFLKFGTRVDVLFTDNTSKNFESKTIMKNVLVMNADQNQSSVTLAIRPENVETLAYAISRGKIELSIRPTGERNAKEEYMSLAELNGSRNALPTTIISTSGIEIIKGTKKEKAEL